VYLSVGFVGLSVAMYSSFWKEEADKLAVAAAADGGHGSATQARGRKNNRSGGGRGGGGRNRSGRNNRGANVGGDGGDDLRTTLLPSIEDDEEEDAVLLAPTDEDASLEMGADVSLLLAAGSASVHANPAFSSDI
jgi:hypothetical protein